MAKLRLYALNCLLLTVPFLNGFSQYSLRLSWVDQDAVFERSAFGIPSGFKTRDACIEYVYKIPALLHDKGFAAASIDSVRFDTAGASVAVYLGDRFLVTRIKVRPEDAVLLNASGWNSKKFSGKPLQFEEIKTAQQRILNYMEDNGYPFAKVSLDSIFIDSAGISASLRLERGPLYKIDSIRIYGTARISEGFMQQYLGIADGSIYRKAKLQAISRRLLELPYLQEEHPWNVTMLGSGSILNLYLKPRKSSQVDVLVGFLPNTDQSGSSKLLVTGEATLNLKNSFGNGEGIGLQWQQLQSKSPRLNISFQQPYLFNSPFGINAAFALYKKDSSYINIDGTLGIQYMASATRSGTVFIQGTSSNLLTIDTLQVISTRQLPAVADMSSVNLGVSYEYNNTNYRFNPLRGNEWLLVGTVGTKKIKRNNQIEKLIDPRDSVFSYGSLYDTVKLSSYQFRVNLAAAHYFQLSRASTLKLCVNAAAYQSGSTFRNDLFQIGGYKLLRGFDEESILASVYSVGTLEYRYLIGQNSFLFSFFDGGWAKNTVPGYQINSIFLGIGLGLAFETKAGIFNISYAVGKRDSDPFALRQAKIHLGYVNFF